MQADPVPNDGPYLSTAVFCEKVLQEQDGVLSLIRIVDRITAQAEGPGAPVEMPSFPVTLTGAFTFKAGAARGRQMMTLRGRAPSGLQLGDELSVPVLFEGEDRGANVVVNFTFQAEHEGVYWFDLLLDDHLLTRLPLRILYLRLALGPRR